MSVPFVMSQNTFAFSDHDFPNYRKRIGRTQNAIRLTFFSLLDSGLSEIPLATMKFQRYLFLRVEKAVPSRIIRASISSRRQTSKHCINFTI